MGHRKTASISRSKKKSPTVLVTPETPSEERVEARLGLCSVGAVGIPIAKAEEALAREAALMGANAVIGVQLSGDLTNSALFWGLAVWLD